MASSNPQYLGKFQRGVVSADGFSSQRGDERDSRSSSKRSKRLAANPRRVIAESLRRQDADQEIRNLGWW